MASARMLEGEDGDARVQAQRHRLQRCKDYDMVFNVSGPVVLPVLAECPLNRQSTDDSTGTSPTS